MRLVLMTETERGLRPLAPVPLCPHPLWGAQREDRLQAHLFSANVLRSLGEQSGLWREWGVGWTPPRKTDQHLSGRSGGQALGLPLRRNLLWEMRWPCCTCGVCPAWADGRRDPWTVSYQSPSPQRGSQAELVKAHRLGG